MATRGQRKQLSKAELTRLEKEAEKRSAERQAANKEKSKEEMKKRTTPQRVTRRQAQARRQIPSQVREMMISKEQDEKNKQAEKKNKPTRRQAVQSRRAATNSIPKPVRDLMISEKQDAQNKGDSKLRSQNRRGPSKSTVDQAIKSATDKAKSTVKSASKIGKLAKGMTGVGALLTPSEIGVGKGESRSMAEEIAKGTRDANLDRLKKQMADIKKKDAEKKKTEAPKTKSTQSDAPAGPPRTIAEAKKRGLDYFVNKAGQRRAAVTKEELDASGLSLRDYLNKKQGKTRKMAKGGYANCGASMKPTQKSSQGVK